MVENRPNISQFNTLETSKPLETTGVKPFEIRGHRLFSGYFGPRLFRDNYLRWVNNRITESTRKIRRGVLEGSYYQVGSGDRLEYALDILGDNPTVSTVKKHNEELFTHMATFFNLREDAPVMITRKPDGVCKTCVIGRHCTDREFEEYPDSRVWFRNSADKENIEHFIEIVEWIGREEGKDFIIKMKPRRKKPDIESILTTKKVLLEAIKYHREYQEWLWKMEDAEFEQKRKDKEPC